MGVQQVVAAWMAMCGVLAFVWGTCVGSFLNVCICRIPHGESVVRPRSRCPRCGRGIAWYDNIPVLSYMLLRARCRHCDVRISPRYVIVEVLTGVLFLLVWFKYAWTGGPRPLGLAPVFDPWLVPVYWVLVSGLLVAAFVDCEHMIIPDRISLGGTLAGLVLSPLLPVMHGTGSWVEALVQAAIGAAAGAGSLYMVAVVGRAIFRKDAMGLGDVKLLAAVGAFLGWPAVVFTIVASSALGSVVGIGLVMAKRKKMQSRIPFGPYLVAGTIVWMLWGPVLLDRYIVLVTGRIG